MTFQEFANQHPDIVRYALNEAFWLKPISDDKIEEMVTDFQSDAYWNDPKCVSQRIRAENGESWLFFEVCVLRPTWLE